MVVVLVLLYSIHSIQKTHFNSEKVPEIKTWSKNASNFENNHHNWKISPFQNGDLKKLTIFCSQKVFKIEILDFRNFQNSEILPWNICMTLMSLSYHCVYSLVGRNAISRWIYSQTAFLLLSCHLEFSRSSHRKLLLREVDKWSNAEKKVRRLSWYQLKISIISL